jgi:hypothetical protein
MTPKLWLASAWIDVDGSHKLINQNLYSFSDFEPRKQNIIQTEHGQRSHSDHMA